VEPGQDIVKRWGLKDTISRIRRIPIPLGKRHGRKLLGKCEGSNCLPKVTE